MVSPVHQVEQWLAETLGTTSESVVLACLFAFGLLVAPLVLLGTAAGLTRVLAGFKTGTVRLNTTRGSIARVSARYAYGLVPFGFGMWLAHYGFHLLTGALTIVPVTQSAAIDLMDGRRWGIRSGDGRGCGRGLSSRSSLDASWLGTFGSLAVIHDISLRDYPDRPARATAPWGIVGAPAGSDRNLGALPADGDEEGSGQAGEVSSPPDSDRLRRGPECVRLRRPCALATPARRFRSLEPPGWLYEISVWTDLTAPTMDRPRGGSGSPSVPPPAPRFRRDARVRRARTAGLAGTDQHEQRRAHRDLFCAEVCGAGDGLRGTLPRPRHPRRSTRSRAGRRRRRCHLRSPAVASDDCRLPDSVRTDRVSVECHGRERVEGERRPIAQRGGSRDTPHRAYA